MNLPVTRAGMMLAASPPLVTTPWIWSPGGELLSEETECDLGDHHRVTGVDALPWCGRGVGRLSGVSHIEVGDRQAGRLQSIVGPRVDHHGGVDVVEGAPFEHHHLAAPALFGRGADDPDRHAQFVGDGKEAEARPDGRRGDDVVPAGMPHIGEGVVLGADGEDQWAGSGLGDEGGGQIGRPGGHGESTTLQGRGSQRRRPNLLVGELRMVVDVVTQTEQLGQVGVDGCPCHGLCLTRVRGTDIRHAGSSDGVLGAVVLVARLPLPRPAWDASVTGGNKQRVSGDGCRARTPATR